MNAKSDSIGLGFAYAVAAHLVAFVCLGLVGALFGSLHPPLSEAVILHLVTIGASQLVYLLPLSFWLMRTKRPLAAKGVWLNVAIVFLINGACWGTFIMNFSPH